MFWRARNEPAGVSEGATRSVEIVNKRGLHARASAKFVKCASTFDAEVRVTKDGHTVDARSIMGLMMLAAGPGCCIDIEAEGAEAEAAVTALEQLVTAICIGPDDDMERRRRDILKACDAVDTGDGVILLTDMFGGTPSNLAISVMEQTKAEVIAGLNLPMLIKLASVRTRQSLEEAVACAQEAGRKYISVASYVLAGEK